MQCRYSAVQDAGVVRLRWRLLKADVQYGTLQAQAQAQAVQVRGHRRAELGFTVPVAPIRSLVLGT